jgi:ATP-dependent protease ClpP protease subunit
MKIKRLFNYKNKQFDNELASIPHNFSVAHNESTSEITMYGVIGESWFSDSYTSAQDVDNALSEANGKDILIRLNSPGGSAFDGIAIHNRLLAYKEQFNAKITVRVDGYACSAASLIPLSADEVIMGTGSMIMIHEASSGVWGTKKSFRDEADLLEKLEEGIIDIYETKLNISRDEIKAKVEAETWFSARESVETGFATSIISKPDDAVINKLQSQIHALESEIKKLNMLPKEEPTPVEPINSTKRKRFLF